jgi:hypothetical protein
MTVALDAYLQKIAEDRVPLWLDPWSYGIQVLRKGSPAPWNDVAALVSFHRQLQGLVNSDVIGIDAADFYRYWLAAHPGVVADMAEKRRLGYALRTLLADTRARNHLKENVTALGECYCDKPLILACPSPRSWIADAYCQAHPGETVNASWEDAESAAMYMADFLRNFADCALSGLLLVDACGTGPASNTDLEHYQPVANLAHHYQWQVVVMAGASHYQTGPAHSGFHTITEGAADRAGVRLHQDFWTGGETPQAGNPQFWYASIPADAVPETVLDRLDTLRTTQLGTASG